MSDALRTVTQQPYNAETPLSALAQEVTPTPLFYVRNHFAVPQLAETGYQLHIHGDVQNSLDLSLDEIKSLPKRTVRVALECAGNARIYMTPRPSGTPWDMGAVSVAEWTGTSLSNVLEKAGIGQDAVEALFVGADAGSAEGKEIHYERSLPLPVALHPDTLLVWAMNGEPLTSNHGYPLRLLVPGWYGMAAVKWLTQIRLITRPFDGYFQTYHYTYWDDDYAPDGEPLTRMQVRALIHTPADNAEVQAPVTIEGMAWTGTGHVVSVEISTQDDKWKEAQLSEPSAPHTLQPWQYTWTPPAPGRYTIRARATDSEGNTQPLAHRSNRLGYGNNAVHSIDITVVEASQ